MKRWMVLCLTAMLSLSGVHTVFGAETEETITSLEKEEYVKEQMETAKQQEEMPQIEIDPKEYIPVLMYHHFAQRDMGQGNSVVVTQAELEEQITYFKEQGYKIISLEELDRILTKAEKEKDKDGDSGLDLDIKYLCITMDDGYYSNYDLAYPVFQKLRVPAAIFAVTDSVTNQTGLKKFTWKEAGRMVTNSQVRIYNHTSNHVSANETDAESFIDAVKNGEEALAEHLPQQRDTVKALAYPKGAATPEIQQALLEEGVRLQFTVTPGVISRNTSRTAIPRIMVNSGMTGEEVLERISWLAGLTM